MMVEKKFAVWVYFYKHIILLSEKYLISLRQIFNIRKLKQVQIKWNW